MKFIWELEDLKDDGAWGLMAQKDEELVIIGGHSTTSLRDGFHTQFDSYEELVTFLNEKEYKPVLAPVNASVVIKAVAKKQFNYCGGFQS